MIADERITSFICSMVPDEEGIIGEIEREAVADGVPIVRKETREWLKTILLIKRPLRVLEVGAAVGFSAIYINQFLPDGAHITTIEKWEPRIDRAKQNFERAHVADRITLLEGDAFGWLKRLDESFDFIFMDAAKGQYMNYLPYLLRLLKKDGMLVTDNVLQEGSIAESKFTIARRERTIHMRMREYLHELTHREDLNTAVLPVGDGMSLTTFYRG